LQIVEITFGKGELYDKVMDYYLFLDRRISESYFIANIVLENEALGEGEEKQKEIGKIYLQLK
jgi:disulfide oxidoreductase YuzD